MADRSSYSRIDCSSSTPSVQPTIIITSLLASWQRWKIIDFQILFIALNWRFFYFLILAEQRQHSLHKMVFVVLSGKKKIVLPLKIVQIFLSVKIKSRRWKQKSEDDSKYHASPTLLQTRQCKKRQRVCSHVLKALRSPSFTIISHEVEERRLINDSKVFPIEYSLFFRLIRRACKIQFDYLPCNKFRECAISVN